MLQRLAFAMLACLIAVAALLLSSGAAAADVARKPDRRAEAKARYDAAIRKFDAGKYDEAAEDFVTAYELVGESAILYNIAQAYRLGERYEKAAQFYRSFLRNMTTIANRAEIEGRIIEMDERAADQRRQAERKREEQQQAARKLEGKKAPPPVENTEAQAPKSSESPKGGRGLKIAGYFLCGFSAAWLGTGIAMSVLATHAKDDVESAASAMAVFTPELRDTESRGQLYDKLAIASYSIAGAAAIGGALAIYFGFRAEQSAAWESETPVSRLRPWLLPSVSATGAGLAFGGQF